jgi:hypothetical protein
VKWIKKLWEAHQAWRNVEMYQDLALTALVVGDRELAIENMEFAEWWYHRMNFIQGVEVEQWRRPVANREEGTK